MEDFMKLAEALWKGETDTHAHHPFRPPFGITEVAKDTWFYKGMANSIFRKTDDGLVLVDPGGIMDFQTKFDAISEITAPRLNTAVYSHGHYDHAFGVPLYVAKAKEEKWGHPQVIAQEALPRRFQRYRETNGWNTAINLRQFLGNNDGPSLPVDFYEPDMTYTDRLRTQVGGVEVYLRHGKGETDDHTWVFFPDTGVLATGDLFIWAMPNGGNPQKVQRYIKEWAQALREMASLNPKVLLPGHGVPIMGADRVRQALEDTAAVLTSVHDQTVSLMNQGATLDAILHTVKVPANLAEKPYLQPVYDEPEFMVRNIYRLYGGWWDGMPSHLKPAPEVAQAAEIAALAGGAEKLIQRALACLEKNDHRMASHLADWAMLAAPENEGVLEGVKQVYITRAKAEPSTMAMGVFKAAAQKAGPIEDEILSHPIMRAQEVRAEKKKAEKK